MNATGGHKLQQKRGLKLYEQTDPHNLIVAQNLNQVSTFILDRKIKKCLLASAEWNNITRKK